MLFFKKMVKGIKPWGFKKLSKHDAALIFLRGYLEGSIGTLIIILLWIYFNSIILLTGFEINVSIFASKKHCSLNSDL